MPARKTFSNQLQVEDWQASIASFRSGAEERVGGGGASVSTDGTFAGSADHVFMDLHVWFRGDMPLDEAHRLSHVVKDRLMTHFPAIADVIIHIEPPLRGER